MALKFPNGQPSRSLGMGGGEARIGGSRISLYCSNRGLINLGALIVLG